MGIFDAIGRGFSLTLASIRIIQKEPWMFFLPIISTALLLGIIASFVVLAGGTVLSLKNDFTLIAVIFVFYFISYVLTYFTQAMIVFGASQRFEGKDPTIGSSFSAALGALDKKVLLALIGAIIGLLTRIASGRDSQGRRNIFKEILASLIGVAWAVASYFSLPVILNEKVGVLESFKRSYELVTKSWGEQVTSSISLFFLYVPGGLLALAGIVLLDSVGIYLIGLGIVLIIVAAVLSASVRGVISQAVYVYATKGTVPTGFEADQIQGMYRHN